MKPRGIIIAGNWKMNRGPKEAAEFFEQLSKRPLSDLLGSTARPSLTAALFPPMLSLSTALESAGRLSAPVVIGAQNLHWEKSGAYTGEVSGPMAQELGMSWALVGHSERRQYFGETDETARKRTESLLAQGFRVMLCIGETRAEREAGKTSQVIETQLQGAIPQAGKGAAPFLDGRLMIAYEPVWAIGTGLTATPEQAQEAHRLVRDLLGRRFGAAAAERTSILYGGSVTPENVDSLLACPDVDGALVGGASVKPESYFALLQAGATALAG